MEDRYLMSPGESRGLWDGGAFTYESKTEPRGGQGRQTRKLAMKVMRT